MAAVDLVVNSYERTYRRVLSPGFFASIEDDNCFAFASRWAVINNVVDRVDAERRGRLLCDRGEIDGFVFVTDRIEDALRTCRIPRRCLGRRPYFLDYALVMAITGESAFLLGWDAELRLDSPTDWITPAIGLLDARSDVFSAAPRWPVRDFDTLDEETISVDPPWHLTWSFSDQVWLVRRAELAAPIFRRFAPASLARHSSHPFTFEGRVESYQRATRRSRAVHGSARFSHNDLTPVLSRLGDESRTEAARERVFSRLRRVLRRARIAWPRFRLP